jgi:hypothetical protein
MVKSVMPVHLTEYLNICKKRFNIMAYLLKGKNREASRDSRC